jgi:hypothetical protein
MEWNTVALVLWQKDGDDQFPIAELKVKEASPIRVLYL